MSKYALRLSGCSCPVQLPGETLVEAIEGGMSRIVSELGIGSAAGYRLVSIIAKPGNIGGHDMGAVVHIVAGGLPLAHQPQNAHQPLLSYTAYIEGDIDGPIEWFIGSDGKFHVVAVVPPKPEARRPHGAKPDATIYYDPDPAYLRSLVERTGLSQNAAARTLGVSERSMRYYLSETDRSSPAPYLFQVALEDLAQTGERRC
jgi:hypothetical protein